VVPFQFVSVTPPDGFVDVTTLPAALMRMEHVLLDKDGELMLRQTVSFTGKLGRVFGWIIGRGMKRDMPGAMRSLLRLAEAS
jgi:uncharacterized protein YrrD